MALDPKTQVGQCMTELPLAVEETASLHEAYTLMRTQQIRHLPVMASGALVGLLSDGDLKMVSLLPDATQVKVGDVMTDKPYTAQFDLPVKQVVDHLSQNKIGSAIILDSKCQVAGIFTVHDALKLLSQALS